MIRKANKTPSSEENSDKLMNALKVFVRTRGSEYLKDQNISSIGIGYKRKGGKSTKQLAIQFTVNKKAEPEELESLDTIALPKSFTIQGIEVPTDVIQRNYEVEYRLIAEVSTIDRKRRLNPIVPGISVANTKVSAGTIGCIVYDKVTGTKYILSNWHVINGPRGAIGDDIAQPGPFDDNRVHLNHLGKLARSHLGHAGDCAIATIEGRDAVPEIMDLGIAVEELGEPELGDKIVKSGRTTGVTHGIVSRIHMLVRINYGDPVGEKEIGGFEIEPDPDNPPDNGEVSMGGDSGSVWVFKSDNGQLTKIVAGLHFAGESSTNPREYAIACYAKSVFEKLEISLSPPHEVDRGTKTGFSRDFLSTHIDLPTLSEGNKQNVFYMDESEVICYTHFSLALNKIRRLAFWVGWNIDGENIRRLSRRGIQFSVDPRIPIELQAGESVYADNRLDRGHIARRADLVWGGPTEAKNANKDSFYFTNIAPQMDDFNQGNRGGLWGRLEDAVFEDTYVEGLRVSVFAGPVFRDHDKEYRRMKLPREFWKVIAFVENHKLKAKGFLLTQNLDELEVIDLDPFRVYQVGLGEIEARCGLEFPAALKAADSIGMRLSGRPEAFAQRKPLLSLKDIDWS